MGKTFDKETWLKAKTEKLDAAKAALEAGLKALDSSDDWKKLLDAMAHAGAVSVMRYSFGNNLLIQLARPGTAYAATYKQWQEKGRQVRSGEKGIGIIRPIVKRKGAEDEAESTDNDSRRGRGIIGFGLVTVFTLDQTEGESLPKPRGSPKSPPRRPSTAASKSSKPPPSPSPILRCAASSSARGRRMTRPKPSAGTSPPRRTSWW